MATAAVDCATTWRSRFVAWCGEATTLRSINGWLTLAWLLLAVPAVLWWKNSIPFLVFVSIYANVAGHLAAWQAARTEVKQDGAEAEAPPQPTLTPVRAKGAAG